ncbi:MAG: hypothetical protein P8Y51_01720 [Campylobacterales bacterium]
MSTDLFNKKSTPPFDESSDPVEAFDRQMQMENLKTGSKKSRDYTRYLVIGAVIAALVMAIIWINHFGFFQMVIIVALVAGFYLYMQKLETEKVQSDAERKDELLRFKYRDAALMRKIKKGVIWKGESTEQLVDSLGAPDSIKPLNGRDTNTAIWDYGKRVAYESDEDKKKLIFEDGLLIELKEGAIVGWKSKEVPPKST